MNKTYIAVIAVVVVLLAVGFIVYQSRGGGGAPLEAAARTAQDAEKLVQAHVAEGLHKCFQQGVQPGTFSSQQQGTNWLVTLSYTRGGASQRAQWLVQANGDVKASNKEAETIDAGCQ